MCSRHHGAGTRLDSQSATNQSGAHFWPSMTTLKYSTHFLLFPLVVEVVLGFVLLVPTLWLWDSKYVNQSMCVCVCVCVH